MESWDRDVAESGRFGNIETGWTEEGQIYATTHQNLQKQNLYTYP